jgi:hypothetical protein
MSEASDIKAIAEAAKGILDAVPVYDDAVQPAAKEVGKALQTVGKAVNVALGPVAALVWGYDKIAAYLQETLARMLSKTPQSDIVTPPTSIAGPALEALRFVGDAPDLRTLYAKLLATAMDKQTAARSHPAFVETIKQLSPDEAKILSVLSDGVNRPVVSVMMTAPETPGERLMSRHQSMLDNEAKVEHPVLVPAYLDNLCRLGLTEIPNGTSMAHLTAYDELESDPPLKQYCETLSSGSENTVRLDRGLVRLTDLGRQFVLACVLDHTEARDVGGSR